MKLAEWEKWLVEEAWQGYPLDEILVDTSPLVERTLEGIDYLTYAQALRSLFIITSGFNGEGGETVEHFKKWIRDGKIDKFKAALELGDRLAYLTWLARMLGFSLEDIAGLNHAKLTARANKENS